MGILLPVGFAAGRLAACCPTPLIRACTRGTNVHDADAEAESCMIVSLIILTSWMADVLKQRKRGSGRGKREKGEAVHRAYSNNHSGRVLLYL